MRRLLGTLLFVSGSAWAAPPGASPPMPTAALAEGHEAVGAPTVGSPTPTPSTSTSTATPTPTPTPTVSLSMADYLGRVARANLELAAQRVNVEIADAQIAIARVFPDPLVTAGLAAIDVSNHGSPTTTTVGVSQAIELGGKRGARVRAAETARTVAQADVEDFFRILRANAAGAFIDAIAARLELDQKRRSLVSLERLVTVNEQRVRAGDIGDIALVKTRVEAQRFKSDVLQAQGDLEAAELALAQHIGGPEAAGMIPEPHGDLKIPSRDFSAERLIALARERRPDLLSRRLAVGAAGARLDLAHANRWIDLDVAVGWQHSGPGTGEFAQPAFDALGGTLTVPLPFSRVYRGELRAALAGQGQATLIVSSADLRVQIEVRQALARYRAAAERVRLFSGGTVSDAEHVFEASLYNYQRGGASLLEVLDAQRILNDVYLSYFDALRAHARALVEVETAAGLWDVDL